MDLVVVVFDKDLNWGGGGVPLFFCYYEGGERIFVKIWCTTLLFFVQLFGLLAGSTVLDSVMS